MDSAEEDARTAGARRVNLASVLRDSVSSLVSWTEGSFFGSIGRSVPKFWRSPRIELDLGDVDCFLNTDRIFRNREASIGLWGRLASPPDEAFDAHQNAAEGFT